jgi:quercetin dioxygenase-like cupin family protein
MAAKMDKIRSTGTSVPSPLPAGAPWPAVARPGDTFVNDDQRAWVEMAGYPGSAIKVLYADRASNTAAFLYRLAPNQSFPMHEHRCRAFAYTLDGDWNYGNVELAPGGLAVEQVGSTHYPETGATGFTVFTVLIGEPGEEILLRSQDPDTGEVAELGIEYFVELMNAV